jgi:release factor glutamine methyltransferase
MRHPVIIRSNPEVYDPSEDTMLLADNLIVKSNDTVLEIGSGCGYVSLVAAFTARHVVGVDINPFAVKLAKLNATLNHLSNVEFVLGDLFSPINGKFSLILMNPPYLQTSKTVDHRYIDYSWNGGEDGRALTDRFLKEVKAYLKISGRTLIVQSSLSGCQRTIDRLSNDGFRVRIVAEKRLFFETLCLVEATNVGFNNIGKSLDSEPKSS